MHYNYVKQHLQQHQRPLFIAEIGVNHNGDLSLAKQMIDAAIASGADMVKFQSFQACDVACRSTLSAPHIDAALGVDGDVYTLLEKLALPYPAQTALKHYADAAGIAWASTPFGLQDVAFLHGLDVPFIKIGSSDVTHHAMLSACVKTGRPVILSTGMANMLELDAAVACLQAHSPDATPDLSLLHCASLYPPPDHTVNLQSITAISQRFPQYAVGFSDHTLEALASLGAVALGACIIEKHFTLDRSMPGPDQAVSADPGQFAQLVADCTRLYRMRGIQSKYPSEAEQANITAFRRSLVTTRAIAQGEVLTSDMFVAKRPGTGLAPNTLADILGKQAAFDIPADTPLTEDAVSPVACKML